MKKRIFLIITRLDTGGSSEAVTAIKHGLAAKYDISIVSGPGEQTPDILISDLQRDGSLLTDIKAFFELYTVLREHKPDIVHTNSSKAGFLGRLACLFAGIRNVVHMPHGHVFYGYDFGFIKESFFLALEIIMAPAARILIALTNGEMKESLARGVGRKAQWTVVHPGTEIPGRLPQARIEKRRELNISDSALVIGTVARLEPVKGVLYLIKAFKLICEKYNGPLNLLIVGDGSLRAALETEAKALGIDGKCVFTGTRKDVYELMSAMDIFVQPSVNEGMGKTIIQAQASGLPVVASRVQGIPDALRENMTGLLVEAKNPGQISEAVMTLAHDPAKRGEMGKKAKEWAISPENGLPRFGTARMVFLIEKIYENLLI